MGSHVTDCSWHPGSQLLPLSLSTDQGETPEARGLCGTAAYLCNSRWPWLLTLGVAGPGARGTPFGLNLGLLRPPPHLVQPVALLLGPVRDAGGACV